LHKRVLFYDICLRQMMANIAREPKKQPHFERSENHHITAGLIYHLPCGLKIITFQKGVKMFKNKTPEGRNNICGIRIAEIRRDKKPKMSQRMLADLLQLNGLDVDKNAIQKIESGQRFVTDIELRVISSVLGVTYEDLLD